jgi:T4 RnlA family RNA ligase
MKYFIPTYEQCREICDANDNFTFYETKHVIDGYNISIFNYRLAMPFIFTNPVPGRNDIQAHEMRGITFVWNKDASLYSHFLLMDKFFNLNQSDCSCYALMKHEKIKNITYKEDGSILTFIKLPNGKIIAKTKASFEADQALRAQQFYEENIGVKNLVGYCLNSNIVPIFEFVGPTNRVVLKYAQTNLVLIKLRNNLTGEYIDVSTLPLSIVEGISVVKTFEGLTLDDLIKKCETDTGYEGFVVTFESGKMIKLKLQEYCNLHNLHTEDLHREDSIIYLIINEQIDDILCQLDEGDERRTMVLELIDLVNHYVNRKFHAITQLLAYYTGDKKIFALTYRTHENFAYAMGVVNRNADIITLIKDKLLKDTYFLFNARKWVETEKLKLKQ